MGDLLTFAIEPRSPALASSLPVQLAPRPASGPDARVLALRPGQRHGLRRGMTAASWYDLGRDLERTDPERAIAAYERALAGCPDLPDAHNNLGRLLHDAGGPAVAEGHYRLAICAESNVALYWFNLGVAVEDQGRYAEAIAAYGRAVELDDRAADAHFNLARLLELTARQTGDDMMLRRAVRHLLRYRALTKCTAGAR